MINPITHKKQIIDVIKYRWLWVALSILLILPGLVAMIYSCVKYENHLPFRVGIDFVGGSIFQYSINKDANETTVDSLRNSLIKAGIEAPVIQILKSTDVKNNENTIEDVVSIRTQFINEKQIDKTQAIDNAVISTFPDAKLVSVSSIGPSLGTELFKNSMIALILAFAGIVGYLAFRFQLDYGLIALLTLAHDALFVCGVFSILGLFYGVHIDALFVTAILTVIGFSVHDTIVIYDRIRENCKYYSKKLTFDEITNASVNQTLARSVNTSVSTLLTLLALYFFGGVTTKDFVLVMILGIIIGTYSSIFFASTLLAWYRDLNAKKIEVQEVVA